MKYKIWIWAITAVASLVIIKYYVTDFEGNGWSTAERLNESEEIMIEKVEEEKQEGIENGETEVKTAGDTMVRVLIKTNDFDSIFHEKLSIGCEGDFLVKKGNYHKVFSAGENYQFTGEEPTVVTSLDDEGLIICDLKRNQEQPIYEGSLELTPTENGIVIINQLPLEEYLPKVLSSEMPSAFPMEALKAQAISARTYAMKKIEENKNTYFGADLDDSVSYQVYNNVQDSPETRKAVEETRGVVLMDSSEEGDLSEVYYYSTSCGITPEDSFETEEAFREFITSVRNSDLEKEESWYRWQTEITLDQIGENLSQMGYEVSGVPRNVAVILRSPNGRAEQLKIDFPNGKTEIIEGEYYIRKALAPGDGSLVLQDGSVCDGLGMLPSGWFVMERKDEMTELTAGKGDLDEVAGISYGKLVIFGGGYGHGNGLSQNGARLMAEQGMDYQQILNFYYPDQLVRAVQ